MKDYQCVICGKVLKPVPTKWWWIKIGYRRGACFDCVLNLAKAVLEMMQKGNSGGE